MAYIGCITLQLLLVQGQTYVPMDVMKLFDCWTFYLFKPSVLHTNLINWETYAYYHIRG